MRKHDLFHLCVTLFGAWAVGGGGSSSDSDSRSEEVLSEIMTEMTTESNGQATINTTEGGVARESSPVAVAASGTQMQVLTFGDSHTAGYGVSQPWPDKLELALGAPMFRQGVVGETTSQGLARLPDTINQFQPTQVCLMYGTVDALQKIDPNTTLANGIHANDAGHAVISSLFLEQLR